MKRIKRIVTIFLLCFCTAIGAQDIMRIHYKNGAHTDIPIAEIDSLTFVDSKTGTVDDEATLVGSWLWGSREAGYYELLTFNDDHTYTGYDNYFTYGFDTQTYGWYSHYGAMLTLQSNGFGYQRLYNWYIIGLASNALEVMTKMGPFTYYRLQPEAILISMQNPYHSLEEGSSVVFADGVIVKAEGNKLHALTSGTTYILLQTALDNEITAYKVTIE